VLLVPHDFVDRQQYLHARDTVNRLLEFGCIPIVNENDAIANNEIRYGDNDHLAALLAHLVGADMLVLLTDTEGLYTADPRTDANATVISVVQADDPLLSVSASGAGSDRGSGGMASKLAAAQTNASAVQSAIAGDSIGTRFLPHNRNLSARKLWIAFAAEVEGRIVIDTGARNALVERGTSLLPAGVVTVEGSFEVGAVVEISVDGYSDVAARGIVAMSSQMVQQTRGKRTADLTDLAAVEVVHRDDLVVLKQD
jgi:glutamate 5-kinase